MKNILKSILCVIGASMLFASCEKSPEVLDEIDYSRVLTPTKFEAEVVPATGTDVILTWQKIKNAESYELEVYEQTDDSKEVSTENTGTLVDVFSVAADEIPYTVYDLDVDKSFYARVRGVSSTLKASNWAYLETTFSTSAVRSSLNPVVSARTQTSISLKWDAAEDKADLTSVLVEPVVLKEGDVAETRVAVVGDEISAAAKTIEGLEAGREYRFTLLFGKAGKRGSVTANTRPNIDGTPTVISSAAALLAAIDNQAGDILLQLEYSDAAYDITAVYPDATKKFATIVGDVRIYGNATEDGKKPAISGLVFDLASGATKLHVEDVVLDGAGTGATVENLSAAMSAVEFVNCEISGYAKAIYSVGSSASTASVAEYLVDGCYVHDINADGTQGGDFIDVRAGDNGNFTVKNSTFYACARTFFRMSDNAKVKDILAENCTFNYVTATPSSSNNAGIFAVRVKTEANSVKSVKNVFLNEYNEKEGDEASKGWVRLCRNSTDSYRVDCSGNVYYNTGVAWWTSNAVASPADANGEKSQEEIAMTDATVLTSDPCVNSAAGKLYLSGTAGETIKSLKAGDPRWWDAVQPVIVRETELTLVKEAYTWDFTEKTIYDTEELTANTIIGNARIYATSTVPANVVMSKGIVFSTGASVSPEGVPSYSAVEILTEGYGSVKVTATSDDGLGSMQVLAGGDRYPVLADAKEHTIVLGDLAGENSIYVIADKAVTLQEIEWTKDLTPDNTVKTLATPAVTVAPSKLDEGTAEDVVISWGEVENAADYVLTFNGAEQTLTETSYTVAAADVAILAVGEYPVTVVARPVATSTKYAKSEAGEATLKINKVETGGTETTLTWDFASAEWQAALEAAAASAKGTNQASWTVSLDGFTYTSGTKNGKWDASGFIQPNGSGSTTERVFSFTAPADGVLKVTAATASAGNAREYVVVDASGTDQSKSVDAQETAEFDVKAGEVLIYPKSGIRFYKFEFTYKSGGAVEKELDWNFASAEWQAALEAAAASAKGTNQASWTVSLDGFTYTSGTKNGKWDASGFIQPNGSGSTTERVFSFTAPADGVLTVVAATASSGTARDYVVVDATGTEQTKSVDAQEAIEFEVKAGEVKIYPKAGIRFYEFKFKYMEAGTPAASPQEWDFASAEWQAALAAAAPDAKGTNQANWTVTLDGFTYTSGTKNGKWDASGFIQPNGGGSTTERVFSFTAPADGTLTVTAATASSGTARDYVVVDATGTEQTKSVDAQTDIEFDIVAGEVKIYPKAGIRFYKFAYKP